MMGISFSCPSCGAKVPVPEGSDPVSCPSCGYALSPEGASATHKAPRRCLNCKTELRGGVTVCPRCGTDQETGKRSFGVSKRHSASPDYDSSKSGDRPSYPTLALLLILGAGIAACVYFMNKTPSRPTAPSTPARPPPVKRVELPQQTATQVVAQSVAVQPRPPPPHREDPLKAALAKYEAALRQGRIDSAQQSKVIIEQRFASGTQSSEFWKNTFAPEHVAWIAVYSICAVCTNGTCPVCHCVPTCATCKGSGVCSGCSGVPKRNVACQSCVCRTCDGDGRCPACSMDGTVTCPACSGIGYTERRNTIACESCNGTGVRKGLRTAGGYMPIRCITCGGAGKITQRVRQQCTTCGTKTRIKCTACSGTGRCTACRGAGRAAACLICGGKGVVAVVCKTCAGSAKCPVCSGMGHCQRCIGSGVCYMCRKTGLVKEARLPVPAAWLARQTGFVVFNGETGQVAASSPKAGHHEVRLDGRTLSLDVATNEVAWVSVAAAFRNSSTLFKPLPPPDDPK